MAEPFDSSTILEDVSSIIQTQYMPDFVTQIQRFGATTNRLFSPKQEVISGDGMTMQTEHRAADNARFSTSPLGAFANPDAFQATTLRIRFNRSTPSSNDVSEISASVQVDDIDVQEAGKGSIVDFVDRVYGQVMPDYNEKLAIHRHIGRTAQLALVNGTPTLNNSWYYAGATGTATIAGGGRIKVDNGSIAYFKPGVRLDFVTAATTTVTAGNILVTDVNTSDLSVGLSYQSSGSGSPTRDSTGDLASIADNNEIYFSGEQDKGMYSLGAWYERPTASESFLGGVDRTTAGYRWMLPTATREGSSSAKITKSMWNDLAIAMGFRAEDKHSVVVMSDPTIHQSMRDEIGEDAFIEIPVNDDRMKRFANFGSVGLNYQHGVFGVVQITADPLCLPNRVRFISPETWLSLYAGWKGLRPVKEGSNHWYRMQSETPNTGKSKFWKADWYALQVDFCKQPWKNGEILNVSA